MNIYTVRDNLKNTIAGKEEYLASLENVLAGHHLTPTERTVCSTTAKFLINNLDELKRILADVKQCCEKESNNSWKENPDRMGGQFTQDEIDNANRW